MTDIISSTVKVNNAQLHYLEAGQREAQTILLLHGASFDSQTWQKIGTIALLVEQGYHVIAVDLPGYGKSERVAMDPGSLIEALSILLEFSAPIIVSPSMSGQYSLPYLIQHTQQVRAYVAVAPVGIATFSTRLQNNPTPLLAVWGENDNIVPPAQADQLSLIMPDVTKVIIKGAGHACYMNEPDEFHRALVKFCNACLH